MTLEDALFSKTYRRIDAGCGTGGTSDSAAIATVTEDRRTGSVLGGSMHAQRRNLSLGVFTGIVLLVTSASLAAEPAPLEEVIVTAQKRPESVQDVPIAITVVTGDMLKNRDIDSSYELQRLVPNLTWNDAGGAGSNVGLRGMVDVNFTTGTVGSVGIIVDEVGINSPVANKVGLMDVDRVEVLRGPQSTLYGRSTTGGAINFNSRRPVPGAAMTGSGSVSGGNYDQLDFDGAISLPVGDRVAFRLAAQSHERGGTFNNLTLGTTDSDWKRQQARLSMVADINDELTAYSTIHGYEQTGQSTRYKSIGYFDPGGSGQRCSAPIRVGNGCADAFGFVDNGNYSDNFSNFPNPIEDVNADGGMLNLKWHRSTMSLTSITAYEQNHFSRNEDTDGTPTNVVDVAIDAKTQQFSQEFRLASEGDGPLRWLLGGFYLDETQNGITSVAVRFADVFIATAYDQQDLIYSGYGQLDYIIDPRWSLTLGVRYSDETKRGTGTGLDAFDSLVARGIPPPGVFINEAVARSFADPAYTAVVPFDKSWQNTGGKLGLDFHPTDRTLLYASISRGFKGGAFNLAAGPVLADPVQAAAFSQGVKPETLWTYEVGSKLTLLDRRLELNLAAFRNDLTDQQLFIIQPDGAVFLLNAAKATVDGVEAEFRWRATAGLTLSGGAGYLHGRYDELDYGGVSLDGNYMLQVPDVTANLNLRQVWPVASGTLALDVGLALMGKQYFDLPNTLSENAHTAVDARVEYAWGTNHATRVALWAKNLTDERYTTNAADIGTAAQVIPNDPRLYGITLSAEF